jgi:hypothetical protein
VAVAVAALVIAALAGFNPLESPADGDRPTPDGNAAGGPTATLHEGNIVLDYPASWDVFHYEVVSSFTSIVAYLGSVEVRDPCVRTPNSVSCGAAYDLDPGTVVVTITAASFPGRTALDNPAPGARHMEVGGLPGLREQALPFPGVGADQSIEWRFARPDSIHNWYVVRADVRGPGTDAMLGQVQAMIDTLRWDPPLEPLDVGPLGRASAIASVGRYLDRVADDDATWSCFPRGPGARVAEIRREPSGPALSQPLTVRCSLAIEPSEFERWKVTLRIEWGLAGGQPSGHWQSVLYGRAEADDWSGTTESDHFPGSGGGD